MVEAVDMVQVYWNGRGKGGDSDEERIMETMR